MNRILILIFAATLCLVGCKPKEATLSGQAFIVTKGAENVKLGDIEILLIEKSQVAGFLEKKQPAIDSEIQSKQEQLVNAKQELKTESGNAGKAQTYFDWFVANKPYKTNEDRIKIKSQWDNLLKQYINQTNYVNRLYAYSTNNLTDENALNTFTLAINKREEMAQHLNSLSDKLEAIKSSAIAEEARKLEEAKAKLVRAISQVAAVQKILDNSPAAEDYFQDFSPTATHKVLSDADGKFSFSYPLDKPFTIFARAQRAILNKTETYYWLIDARTGAKAQVLLSNNNLVFVDPDGYCKLKPKEKKEEQEPSGP